MNCLIEYGLVKDFYKRQETAAKVGKSICPYCGKELDLREYHPCAGGLVAELFLRSVEVLDK